MVCSVLIALGVLILGAIDNNLAALGAVPARTLKSAGEQEVSLRLPRGAEEIGSLSIEIIKVSRKSPT